ncbi:MAG: YdiU family protein [Candidatus Sericytochromatia bacterium]|nr:YdiU family protein [Candidatus Sericytochromatia bacterium]
MARLPLQASLFARDLPGESCGSYEPRQVRDVVWTECPTEPAPRPSLLAWSEALAQDFGLTWPDDVAVAQLAGHVQTGQPQPWASRYGGHQFGTWAGQLGDGRAHVMGSLVDLNGQLHDVQLKGAGRTPFSRHADGRAALRSSLREHVCSEAMAALGLPTTRSLALVATGEPVVRDMFYDGRPHPEPGAIVARVAPSFIRFGHFQILAAHGELELLGALARHVVTRFYPELGPPGPEAWTAMFTEVCRRTARMIVGWMHLGFVHGVMNTDNMSILGLTLDYGPFGWLSSYDPDFTPNTTDFGGRRYRFAHQPLVAQWNLARLAEALLPLGLDPRDLQAGLEIYQDTYAQLDREGMAIKLGLSEHRGPEDDALIARMWSMLHQTGTDRTIFHRHLALVVPSDPNPLRHLTQALPDVADASARRAMADWLGQWQARIATESVPPSMRADRMNGVNPVVIPRNHLLLEAIRATEAGEEEPLERLLTSLQRPYEDLPMHAPYAGRPPEWADVTPGCATLSCSS